MKFGFIAKHRGFWPALLYVRRTFEGLNSIGLDDSEVTGLSEE